jgi:hypothetical protein
MCKKIICIIFLFLSSCATYIHKKEDFKGTNITSNPSGAYVYVDGTITKTPTNIRMNVKPKEGHIIKFRKEGYKEKEVVVKKKFRPISTIFGNMLWTFWYPLTLWLDLERGAWDFEDDINVTLEKKDG